MPRAKLEEAYKLLGLTNKLYEDLGAIFNRMAIKPIDRAATYRLRECAYSVKP